MQETILEHQAMLLKHEDAIGKTFLQREDVNRIVTETLNGEQFVSHSQVRTLVRLSWLTLVLADLRSASLLEVESRFDCFLRYGDSFV